MFGVAYAFFLRGKERVFTDSRAWRLDRLGAVVKVRRLSTGLRTHSAENPLVRACLRTPAAAVSERVTMHSTRRRAVWSRRSDVGALLRIFPSNLSANVSLRGDRNKSPLVRALRKI